MLRQMPTPLVLLVEDSDDDAFFFNRTLRKSGVTCAVQHATSGAEAVEFLRKTLGPDPAPLPVAIFLDLKMPILNGFEVLEWLQTQNFPAPMRVIVLSGSEHQDDRARAARLGALDYLVKPVEAAELRRVLEELCPAPKGTPA